MDKHELDKRITEVTKSILSYSMSRTCDKYEAEDLAQDIILEIYKSAANIRNDNAFYGFMWSVAGNVYKQWCRKQQRKKEIALSETEHYGSDLDTLFDEDSDVYLLRRELTLLAEKYRRATILYYIENKSCVEISKTLLVSESMVKYLLFKSRQILKEGIGMERNYGEQSYNPKGLSLLYWGNGANRYYNLCDSKISQNILFACYNDKLTAEQISIEIGVGLPYMEDHLKELCEYDVLKKDGNRYYTNIVIFTKDFVNEVNSKTILLKERIVNILMETISGKEDEIRKTGFTDIGSNAFTWQVVCMILYKAIVEKLQNKIKVVYPKDKFGTECFVWGAERCEQNTWKSQYGFGISNVSNESGDYVQFMDFPINGEMVHHYCFNRQNVTNVFLDIAKGKSENFSENDMACAADMIKKGYVRSEHGRLFVNAPVFTKEQYLQINELISDAVHQISGEAEQLMDTVAAILKNHMPLHLKKYAKDMAYLRLFEDTISAPVKQLVEQKILFPYHGEGMLPTTYVILK